MGASRWPACAAFAALALFLLPPATALTPKLHEDYPRTQRDNEALILASQAVVDNCLTSTLLLLREEFGTARDYANASLGLSNRLLVAAQQPLGSMERPALLYVLAPPSDGLGGSMGGLADDVRRLFGGTLHRGEFLFHKGQALDTITAMIGNATTLGGHNITTQPLIDALRALFAVIERMEPPEGETLALDPGSLPQAAGTAGGSPPGTTGSAPQGAVAILAEGPDWAVLVDPQPAWFFQVVRVTVLQAGVAGPLQVEVFGQTFAGRMSGGFGRVTFRVPWDAATGSNAIHVSWPGQDADGALIVIRIPTTFAQPTFEPLPGRITFNARLRDADARNLFPATATWTAAGFSGTAATDFLGRVAFDLPNATASVQLHFAGNRTHAPTDLETLVPAAVSPGSPALPLPQSWLDALAGWLWLLLLLLLLLLLAWEIRRRLRKRRKRQPSLPQSLPFGAPLVSLPPSPGSPVPMMAVDHPLIRVLERAGYPVRAMTLREAGPLWVALGAPQVWPFVRQQEETYYQGRPPAPMPKELMRWAQGHS